jgi:DNA-binding MarR family transcriptional regulator
MWKVFLYTWPMSREQVDQLERIVVGSVAITARAIHGAEAELTFMQWRVLVVVGEDGVGSSVGEIAARIGAHASPASRVISRLKRRGLVRSTKDTTDARVTRVSLSEAGLDLRERILERRGRALSDVLDVLSPKPEDAQALERLARTFEPYA